MHHSQRQSLLHNLRQTIAIASFVHQQSRIDNVAMRSWGIDTHIGIGGIRYFLTYAPLHFLNRFPVTTLRASRFIELMVKFTFYVSTLGDDLLDTYGGVFSTTELTARLRKAYSSNIPIFIGSDDFLSRGIRMENLRSVNRFMLPHMAYVDKVALINQFLSDVLDDDGIIAALPVTHKEQQLVRDGFINVYNLIFASYLHERLLIENKGLVSITLRDWHDNALLKTRAAFETSVPLFIPFTTMSRDDLHATMRYIGELILLAAYADDLKDFELDWSRQPNIVPILAQHYYPNEAASLAAALHVNRAFYGVMGNVQLGILMPRTLTLWSRLYLRELRRISAVAPFGSPMLVAILNCISIASRRRSPHAFSRLDVTGTAAQLAKIQPTRHYSD